MLLFTYANKISIKVQKKYKKSTKHICLMFNANVENFKQFFKENATKLFENFKTKDATDK